MGLGVRVGRWRREQVQAAVYGRRWRWQHGESGDCEGAEVVAGRGRCGGSEGARGMGTRAVCGLHGGEAGSCERGDGEGG